MAMQFSDFRVPIGTRMQLNVIGADYRSQIVLGQLMGYRSGFCLLVQILKKPMAAIQREAKVSVRLGLQSAIIQFESTIDFVCEAPFLYLHLAYPTAVQIEQQLRKNPRFDIDAPITVSAAGDTLAGRMVDISLNGARLLLNREMSDQNVALSADVFAVGAKQQLCLEATIKRVPSSLMNDANSFVYGAAFIEPPPAQKLLLQALCYELQSDTHKAA
jgi:c-di-GMP-binding flagellar brake protein YcgR